MSAVNTSCTDADHDISEIQKGLIVRAATGGVSLIASIIAILIVLLFRKYRPQYLREISTTELLILLTACLAMFRSFSEMFQLSNLDFWIKLKDANDANHYHRLCWSTAFFSHWSFGSMLLGIQVLLLHLILQLTIGVEFTKKRITQITYILSPILLPFLLSSYVPFIPFRNNATYFGLGEGGWCWISDYQVKNCINKESFSVSHPAIIQRYVFYIGPFIIFLAIDLLTILIAYPLLLYRRRGMTAEDRKSLAKQHAPILCLISVSMIFYALAIAHECVSTLKTEKLDHTENKTAENILLYAHAVTSSLWGIVIASCVVFYILALRYTQQPHEEYEDIDENNYYNQSEYVVGSDGTVSHVSGILSDREADFSGSYTLRSSYPEPPK